MSKRKGSKDLSFDELFRSAMAAQERGKFDNAVDHFLAAVVKAPTKWTENRWQAFFKFTKILLEAKAENNFHRCFDVHMESLKQISRDSEEPILFRTQAYYLRGTYEFKNGVHESASIYFGRAFHLIQKATSSERRRQIKFVVENEDGHHVSVGDILDTIKNLIVNNLDALQDPTKVHRVTLETVPLVNGRPDPAITKRLVVGGGSCDCCGKSRNEVEDNFRRCSRCKRAYYCSYECANRQWKSGHKQACRRPNQIESGDWMLVKGLEKRPELNFKLVKVVKPVQRGERWQVKVEGRRNTMSLKPEKLYHIRPDK